MIDDSKTMCTRKVGGPRGGGRLLSSLKSGSHFQSLLFRKAVGEERGGGGETSNHL